MKCRIVRRGGWLMKRWFILVGAVLLAGCAESSQRKGPSEAPAPAVASAESVPTPAPAPSAAYPQVVFLDGLERSLVQEAPVVQLPDQTTPLRVRVPLRSVADVGFTVEYKWVFRDSAGDDTNRNPVWRTITFAPRAREFISANAISLRAVDWELQLRIKH